MSITISLIHRLLPHSVIIPPVPYITLNEKKKSSNYHPFYSVSQRGGWCLHKSLWLNYSGESTHILYDRAWRIARPSIPRRPANLGRGRSRGQVHLHHWPLPFCGICCVSSLPEIAENWKLSRCREKRSCGKICNSTKFCFSEVDFDGNSRFLLARNGYICLLEIYSNWWLPHATA